MRVLITGSSGLLGRAVARAAPGVVTKMVCADIASPPSDGLGPGMQFLKLDMRDRQGVSDAIRDVSPAVIIHLASMLASRCEMQPDAAADVNVLGTLSLLESAAVNRPRRVVIASSGSVYGQQSDRREGSAIGPPLSTYGLTKLLAEKLGDRYSAACGIECVSLRFSLIFSAVEAESNQGEAAAIGRMRRAMAGHDVEVPEMSSTTWRHFLHATDAANAVWSVATHPGQLSGVYNVAGPDENFMQLGSVAEILGRMAPGMGEVRFTGPTRSGARMCIDKLRTDVGFVPQLTVEDAFREALGRQGGLG
ncbi:MAG: NAD(P)-dependent oxidoreductase [Rubrivivax sp.]